MIKLTTITNVVRATFSSARARCSRFARCQVDRLLGRLGLVRGADFLDLHDLYGQSKNRVTELVAECLEHRERIEILEGEIEDMESVDPDDALHHVEASIGYSEDADSSVSHARSLLRDVENLVSQISYQLGEAQSEVNDAEAAASEAVSALQS